MPVICIGNIVAGGSGKTPVAIALMEYIKQRRVAQNPMFLSKGYGSVNIKPTLVDPAEHSYKDVGDEALLLTRHAPTIVSHSRVHGLKYAEFIGADLIIMDDGFQNQSIVKTIHCLVVSVQTGFGNEKLLPAGPLREFIQAGVARADYIILVGDSTDHFIQRYQTIISGKPLIPTTIEPNTKHMQLNQTYVAFTGLGQPQKFEKTLHDAGFTITDFHTYPDHYQYTDNDIHGLIEIAKKNNAMLITTEKDAVRLPVQFKDNSGINVLSISIRWNNDRDIQAIIESLKS